MYKKRDLNNFPTKENVLKYEINGNRIIFKEGVVLYNNISFLPEDSSIRINCIEFFVKNKTILVP